MSDLAALLLHVTVIFVLALVTGFLLGLSVKIVRLEKEAADEQA